MDVEVLEGEEQLAEPTKLLKALEEFHTYIHNNRDFIPNYGERYRHGEIISTAFVESTVNHVLSKRFVKNNRCVGLKLALTYCFRFVFRSSTRTGNAPSSTGIQA